MLNSCNNLKMVTKWSAQQWHKTSRNVPLRCFHSCQVSLFVESSQTGCLFSPDHVKDEWEPKKKKNRQFIQADLTTVKDETISNKLSHLNQSSSISETTWKASFFASLTGFLKHVSCTIVMATYCKTIAWNDATHNYNYIHLHVFNYIWSFVIFRLAVPRNSGCSMKKTRISAPSKALHWDDNKFIFLIWSTNVMVKDWVLRTEVH